jgi:hypothetical protein
MSDSVALQSRQPPHKECPDQLVTCMMECSPRQGYVWARGRKTRSAVYTHHCVAAPRRSTCPQEPRHNKEKRCRCRGAQSTHPGTGWRLSGDLAAAGFSDVSEGACTRGQAGACAPPKPPAASPGCRLPASPTRRTEESCPQDKHRTGRPANPGPRSAASDTSLEARPKARLPLQRDVIAVTPRTGSTRVTIR